MTFTAWNFIALCALAWLAWRNDKRQSELLNDLRQLRKQIGPRIEERKNTLGGTDLHVHGDD
jgi:hypothetical protein